MMLSFYFSKIYGFEYSFKDINVNDVIPHSKDKINLSIDEAPKIRQAHHGYWFLYKNQKIVLLVRNLKETLMSAYDKMTKVNDRSISFEEFVKGDVNKSSLKYFTAPLDRRVRFLNRWAIYKNKPKEIKIVKYEKIKINTLEELKDIILFLNVDFDKDFAIETLNFCSKDNMYKLSSNTKGSHKHAVSNKKVRDESNYFSNEINKWFKDYVENNLIDNYGYNYD